MINKHAAPLCTNIYEVLPDAAMAFRAGGFRARSIPTLHLLISPVYGTADRALTQRARLEVGRDYEAIGEFDGAADFYGKADAPGALSDAVRLRLTLGDEKRSLGMRPPTLDDTAKATGRAESRSIRLLGNTRRPCYSVVETSPL